MSRNVKELEEKIGYNFKDSHLLRHAVTHSSYVNEKHMKKADCNERLEFLGDAVLELISSEYLFFENQTMPEGELTKLRASMVCEKALAFCARELELGSYLLLGKGEDATGGRFRESITSDALEALIGAIYLDGGFANAKEFILKYILNIIHYLPLKNQTVICIFFKFRSKILTVVEWKTKINSSYLLTWRCKLLSVAEK